MASSCLSGGISKENSKSPWGTIKMKTAYFQAYMVLFEVSKKGERKIEVLKYTKTFIDFTLSEAYFISTHLT